MLPAKPVKINAVNQNLFIVYTFLFSSNMPFVPSVDRFLPNSSTPNRRWFSDLSAPP
jgi:hypothetical protein